MYKELIYLTIFILVMVFIGNAPADLIAHYEFESGADDSSGNAHHGSLEGGATTVWDTGGNCKVAGNVLSLDGSGDYVNCGNHSDFNITGPMTVVAWIKTSSWGTNWASICGKGEGTWRLQRNAPNGPGDNNGVCLGLNGISPGQPYGTEGNINVADGNWHHVAGVYDGSQTYVYVDGQVDNFINATGSIDTNAYNILIGANSEPTPGYMFSGLIDDVCVYNHALSEGDIQLLAGNCKASNPKPFNHDSYVPQKVVLGWTPSEGIDTQDVYFGTDKTNVTNANRENQLGVLVSQDYTSSQYPLSGTLDLVFGQTYYWRIDGVTEGSPSRGLVWSFTVSEDIVIMIEDFESYADIADLRSVWDAEHSQSPPSQATIYLEAGTAIDSQSMKLHYDNTSSPYYSEADLVFDTPRDWTQSGVEVLRLSFWGTAANDPERMHVALEDANEIRAEASYDRNPEDLKHEVIWHILSIPLKDFSHGGVDLTKIKKLTIGFNDGDEQDVGDVYFDDISLALPRYSPIYGTNADIDGDGIVDVNDLAIIASSWCSDGGKLSGDIYEDGVIDYKDFGVIGEQWHDYAIFNKYRPKLLELAIAGLESVYWRQDSTCSPYTGGIIESDVRVDGGRCLYCPYAWPRCYIVEPLLTAGKFSRAKDYMNFWINCENMAGTPWLHCYDVCTYWEYPGIGETDNIGYMLWHFAEYVKATNDLTWLNDNWSHIEYAGNFLINERYNPTMKLVWGDEEYDPTQVDPCLPDLDIKYSLHINIVCARGLLEASELADMMDETATANTWRQTAETILTEVPIKLWDDTEKTFMFGLDINGVGLTAPIYWMNLMPFLHFDRFDDKLDDTLDFIKRNLYNKDPKIAKTYWGNDHSAVLDGIVPLESYYSGLGPFIGALPVYIHCFLKTGRYEEAEEQLVKIFEWTNPENNLIPEHVNTIHHGQYGHSSYPETHSYCYYVDSGNLLHEAFLLTLIARYEPELLIKASQMIESEP